MNTKIHYFYIPRKRWTIFIERKGRRCSQEITDSSDYTDYTLDVHLTSQLSFRRPKELERRLMLPADASPDKRPS